MSKASLCSLTLLALPLALPVTGSGSPGTGQGSTPALGASVEQCVTGETQADRSVTFTAQMETIAAAHRMAMQIVVQERAPGDAYFHALGAAGPGVWQRSEVGVKIYKYVRQVTDLPAPAAFRATVQYRWLNEKGHVIKTAWRHTPICREPSERTKSGTSPTPEAPPTATMPKA